ncbi:hypothetical protein C6P18_02595 [Weissella confusa]|nr:hypothetical protein C6P18_02595 [Weissella confusa]TGE59902.1 hypothetical protein C6P19_02730 [Weissella confusa]
MNLYKISQDVNDDWDTYDSAVVVAESAEAARKLFLLITVGVLMMRTMIILFMSGRNRRTLKLSLSV